MSLEMGNKANAVKKTGASCQIPDAVLVHPSPMLSPPNCISCSVSLTDN